MIWTAQPNKSFVPSNPDLPIVKGCPHWGQTLAEVDTFVAHAGHGIVDIMYLPVIGSKMNLLKHSGGKYPYADYEWYQACDSETKHYFYHYNKYLYFILPSSFLY